MAITWVILAHAQVNVESLRTQLQEANFGARMAGSLSSYAGNTQGVMLGSRGPVGAPAEWCPDLLGTGPTLSAFRKRTARGFLRRRVPARAFESSKQQAGTAGEGTAYRFGNYAAITFRAHRRIVLTSVSYFQRRFDAPSDVKILNVTQAAFEITGMLGSRIDVTLRYDSVGHAVVNRTVEIKNSLELVF